MEVQIRRLTNQPRDVLLGHRLIEAWYNDDGLDNPKFPTKAYSAEWLGQDKNIVLVAMAQNKVIGGLIAFELPLFDQIKKEIFLYEIGVVQAYRRQGVARQLINKIIESATDRMVSCIFVATSINNEAAKHLYQSTGGELELVPFYTYTLFN